MILDHTKELYNDICSNMLDYRQIGYTVCGSQDPAVIYLDDSFGEIYPELKKYRIVRVKEKFLNAWNSETFLEFSSDPMTNQEYDDYEKIMDEDDENNY